MKRRLTIGLAAATLIGCGQTIYDDDLDAAVEACGDRNSVEAMTVWSSGTAVAVCDNGEEKHFKLTVEGVDYDRISGK